MSSARAAFVDGLTFAAGIGAVVLLATAVAAWFPLRGQRLENAPWRRRPVRGAGR